MKHSYRKFVKIREHADDIPQAATWFHEQGHIIAGIGVIENDFHPKKEYTPNVCALYVEEAYRRQGYAKMLLEEVEKNMGKMWMVFSNND